MYWLILIIFFNKIMCCNWMYDTFLQWKYSICLSKKKSKSDKYFEFNQNLLKYVYVFLKLKNAV